MGKYYMWNCIANEAQYLVMFKLEMDRFSRNIKKNHHLNREGVVAIL